MFLKGRDLPAGSTAQLWACLRAGMLVTRPLGCEQPRGAGEKESHPCLCPNPAPPDEEMLRAPALSTELDVKLFKSQPWPQEPGPAGILVWPGWEGCATRGSWSPSVHTGNPGRSSPGQGEPLLSCWSILQLRLRLLQGVGICTGVLWIIKCQNMKL